MLRAIAPDRVNERRMRSFDPAVEDDNDPCRQGVVAIRQARQAAAPGCDDVAQQWVGQVEHTGREIHRVANRNQELLLDHIHRLRHREQPRERTRDQSSAEDRGRIEGARVPTRLIAASSRTSESTPALTARRITSGCGSFTHPPVRREDPIRQRRHQHHPRSPPGRRACGERHQTNHDAAQRYQSPSRHAGPAAVHFASAHRRHRGDVDEREQEAGHAGPLRGPRERR